MRTKGVLLALLPLMLLFTGICEAQMPDPGHIINFGDGGRPPPDDSVPEPSTASLLLLGLTAALAFRRRS